jgi:NADP-dependent 3-hydroxy acid dehydrogenase YdfG
MSLEDWHAVIKPKLQGTMNLHEVLINEPLDFFVMTSSVIGTTGAPTQTSYAAANAALDSIARHRRSMGLPATSLSLGMIVEVGHVESNPGEQTMNDGKYSNKSLTNSSQR